MPGHRQRDSVVEREVAAFLDSVVYPKIGASVIRQTDRDIQLSGIDILFTYKDLNSIAVDEKALTHYINKDIPTSAFELSFLHNGKVVEGWLTDDDKATQYYMLIWLHALKDWNVERSDITHAQLYLVSRSAVLGYLEEQGFGINALRKKAEEIREADVGGALEKREHDGFYFFLTKDLVEQPVNVVLRKDILRSLAKYRFAGPENRENRRSSGIVS